MSGLRIHNEPYHELNFRWGVDARFSVSIRNATQDEVNARFRKRFKTWHDDITKSPELVSIISAEYLPDPKIVYVFECLSKGELPDGVTEADAISTREYWTDVGPADPENPSPLKRMMQKVVVDQYLPKAFGLPFNEFVRNTSQELVQTGRDAVNKLRWRFGSLGGHDPVISETLSYSLDGENWLKWGPREKEMSVDDHPIVLNTVGSSEIDGLMLNGISEPLAHQMFREAWAQLTENPRSAVILAVASAEVAVKNCLTTLAPATSRLIEELPSPDVRKLLKYIEDLGRPNGTKTLKVPNSSPEKMLNAITDGIEIRNKLVHLGYFPSNHEKAATWAAKLEEFEKRKHLLESIRDLLWIMDYNTGNDWAIHHIRASTRASIGM